MKLLIPSLGSMIRLKENSIFKLHFEKRNSTLLAGFLDGGKKLEWPRGWAKDCEDRWDKIYEKFREAGLPVQQEEVEGNPADLYRTVRDKKKLKYITATLQAGTILSFDRYYIRQGVEGFDSITFYVKSCPGDIGEGKRRFWVKLQDANNIDCDLIG